MRVKPTIFSDVAATAIPAYRNEPHKAYGITRKIIKEHPDNKILYEKVKTAYYSLLDKLLKDEELKDVIPDNARENFLKEINGFKNR